MNASRIVSLLPGATEWLCALGLSDRLIGVSHECDFPPQVNALPQVTRAHVSTEMSSAEIDREVRRYNESQTSLYELDVRLVADLRPDLILTQTLCNVCAVRESDVRRSIGQDEDCQLLDLSATTFDGVIDDAQAIITATGNCQQSTTALERLRQRITDVQQLADPAATRPRVTLIEWADPLFCSGHWTPQLIQWAGGDDPIGVVGQPSRQITGEELVVANPEILLVACCGLDAERNAAELETLSRLEGWSSMDCVRSHSVHVLDGSAFFNRPGPRLVDALEMVASMIRRR